MSNVSDLLYPKEAAVQLNISLTTITRCVKLGAPVHRWGSTGYRYRIDPDEFIAWMESQGPDKRVAPKNSASPTLTVEEMAARNRARMRSL